MAKQFQDNKPHYPPAQDFFAKTKPRPLTDCSVPVRGFLRPVASDSRQTRLELVDQLNAKEVSIKLFKAASNLGGRLNIGAIRSPQITFSRTV